MILKNSLKFFVPILFLISFSDILAEKIPKCSNIEPGGISKRKLEGNDHYIIVKYKEETNYDVGYKFANDLDDIDNLGDDFDDF